MHKYTRSSALLLLGLHLTIGAAGWVAVSSPAFASAETDRKYALENIGALRSWDNADGLFADYVAAAYKEYFAKQSRFRLVDMSKADAVFSASKIPYAKAIEDNEILSQLSRSLRAQTLLRTRIRKEGPQYRFTIEWLHSPGMDVLSSETFTLNDPIGLDLIAGSLKTALDNLFRKVPFIGLVTGRDDKSVTINLGSQAGIKRGDTLLIATLDEVKKHPLLKELVEWRLTHTGRAEVDQVEENISFAHITQEEEGRQIARYQKITQILPRIEQPVSADPNKQGTPLPAEAEQPPRLGFARASLWTGGYSRQFSSQDGQVGQSGGGLIFGARADGQLWFNREFFADLELGYGAFNFSQNDIATGAAVSPQGAGGGIFTFKIDGGYSFYLNEDFFGPKAWVKIGYFGSSYSLPVSAADFTAPFSVKSFFLGLGGDFPIRSGWGARADLEFGVFNSAAETGNMNGTISSANNARFYIGGYYRFKTRVTFQAGLEVQGNGVEYSTNNSLSQKTVTFMPSVVYYF